MGISSFFPGIAGQSVLNAINQFSPNVDLGGINVNQFPTEVVSAGRTGPVLPNNFPLFNQTPRPNTAPAPVSTANNGPTPAAPPSIPSLANTLFGNNINDTFVNLGLIPPNVFRSVDGNGNIKGTSGPNAGLQPNQSGFGILDATNRSIFQFLELPVSPQNANGNGLRQNITTNPAPSKGTQQPTTLLSNGLSPDLAPLLKEYTNALQNLNKQLSGNPAPTGQNPPSYGGKSTPALNKTTKNRTELKSAIEQAQQQVSKDLAPILDQAGKARGSDKNAAMTQATNTMVKSLQGQGFDVKANGKDKITINGQNFSVLEQSGKQVKTRAK